jgi:hypothetical protein
MPWPRLSRCLWVGTLVAAAFGSGCDSPPDDSAAQEVREKLVGTWLRDYEEDGIKVRRVLVLEPGGHFRESSRVTEPGTAQDSHLHAGEWLFDGTNLKRRYTSVDGKLPAAPAMPYATFELEFPSRNEFVGIDRVRGRKVTYARVADGTQP